MKKSLGVFCIALALISQASAVQRVVVIEDFTGTTCPNCPTTANALHQLKGEVKDSLVVLAFHCGNSDPYNTTETLYRASFYGVSGIPTTECDGVISRVGATGYSTYRSDFNTRKAVAPKVSIALSGSYNSSAGTGVVKAHVTNLTGSSITGAIYLIIVETNISYSWEGQSVLYDVVRDMLPPYNTGTSLTIAAGGSADTSKSFLLSLVSGQWNPNNCSIVAYFQISTKEIYQGAEIPVLSIATEENQNKNTFIVKVSPNPFTSNTNVCYSIEKKEKVQIGIYDIAGNLVKQLVNSEQDMGTHTAYWDGKNEIGNKIDAGIYFCVVNSGNHKNVSKILSVR